MANKFETLARLRAAGLPVPRTLAVRTPEEATPALLQDALGTTHDATYAVRSSHHAEDGDSRSFAGQYLTLLNVSEDDVAQAVRAVLASYRQETAYGDHTSHGIAPTNDAAELEPLVVVQPMIHAELSGVAFTSNPEGFVGEGVIVLGRGLGEGVVSDQVSTQTWHIAQDGTTWHYGSLERGDTPGNALNTGEVARKVLEMARSCKHVLGYETDMEFALDSHGSLVVLQARPITMLGGVSSSKARERCVLLDNSNIIESYPGVVLPLTQSFATDMYRRIFAAAVKRLTGDDSLVSAMADDLQHMLVFCDWHAYYRMASWYAVLSLLPLSHAIKRMWRQSLGVTDAAGDVGGMRVRWATKAHVCASVLHHTFAAPRLTARTCDSVEGVLEDAQRRINEAQSMDDLLRAYDDLCDRVLDVWDITLFNDMHAFVFSALAGEARPAGADVASLEPIRAMGKLVDTARAQGLESAAYRRERSRFLNTFGDRTMGELKLESRTWRTNPELIDARVQSELDAATQSYSYIESPGARRVARSLNPFAAQARRSVAMRERSRLMRTRMFGLVRTVFLRCAEELVRQGVMKETRDVFYLTVDEVKDIAAHTSKYAIDGSMGALVDLRKRRESIVATLPILQRLWAAGQGPWEHTMPLGAETSTDKTVAAARCLEVGSVLLGTGTSKGSAEGEVMLVRDADLSVDTTHKVIVAASTDPGWAFILRNATAIIAERGSLLSHTAIISRELGIPAVVGIRDATHLLKDGDVVRVDGSTGSVTLLGSKGQAR